MGLKNRIKMTRISKYLEEQMKGNKTLQYTIHYLGLDDVYAETFKEEFGEMSPEEMAKFLLADGDNVYKIGLWNSRRNEKTIGTGRYLHSSGKRHTGAEINSDRGIS